MKTTDTNNITATVTGTESIDTGHDAAFGEGNSVFGCDSIDTGLAVAERPAVNAYQPADLNPAARLMALREHGADIDTLFAVMNEAFAVTKYGGQIVIASLFGNDINFMTVDDFHKMFANLVIFKQAGTTTETIKVSRRWFEWKGRRQYLGRGVVFEPGGPLEFRTTCSTCGAASA